MLYFGRGQFRNDFLPGKSLPDSVVQKKILSKIGETLDRPGKITEKEKANLYPPLTLMNNQGVVFEIQLLSDTILCWFSQEDSTLKFMTRMEFRENK